MFIPHNLTDDFILIWQYNPSHQTAECWVFTTLYTRPYASQFFYYLKVKTALKWRHFEDSHDINKNVTAKSKAVPSDTFNDCFVQLLEIYI